MSPSKIECFQLWLWIELDKSLLTCSTFRVCCRSPIIPARPSYSAELMSLSYSGSLPRSGLSFTPLSSCLWCAQVLRHKRLGSWPQLSPGARRVTAPHRGLDKPRAWAGLQQVRVRIRVRMSDECHNKCPGLWLQQVRGSVRIESDECHNKCPGLWLLPAVVAASLLLNAVLTVYQTISTGKYWEGENSKICIWHHKLIYDPNFLKIHIIPWIKDFNVLESLTEKLAMVLQE